MFVKGKGDMQTYWIDPEFQDSANTNALAVSPPGEILPDAVIARKGTAEERLERLVTWNADLLEQFLKKVVAARRVPRRRNQRLSFVDAKEFSLENPIDVVTETIDMAKFSEKNADEQVEPESVELNEAVRHQLHAYVDCIARMYRDNAFHNFEHACHVAMSASKVLKRIIKPEGIDYEPEYAKKRDLKKVVAGQIHKSTFGVSSDALMQFAVIFSAVIHDVDHTV